MGVTAVTVRGMAPGAPVRAPVRAPVGAQVGAQHAAPLRHPRIAVVAAVIATMVVACATPAPTFTNAHRAAIVDSVQVMLTAWRDAFNARDFAHAAAFYSSDPAFRWFENGELKFRTAAELGDTMKVEGPHFQSLAMSLIEPEITPTAPGVAEVTANFTQKVTDSAGQTFGLAGAMSMTVVHGDSGWKFLVGHLSVVAPVVDTGKKAKARRT